MRAAKVSFRAPLDGATEGLSIQHFELSGDGKTQWQLSATKPELLTGVEEAFTKCMRAPDLKSIKATEDKRTLWSGTATASEKGLHKPLTNNVEPPRYKNGREFVLAVRNDSYGLRKELYAIRNDQYSSTLYQQLSRTLPTRSGVERIVSDIWEASQAFATKVHRFEQLTSPSSGWRGMRPIVVELEASARPVDILGFAAQIFDTERPLIPAKLTLQPEPDTGHLRLDAKLYTFARD